jgi:acyl dehydratase
MPHCRHRRCFDVAESAGFDFVLFPALFRAHGLIFEEANMGVVSGEELKAMVGTNIGTSDWMCVDQDMINKFADATGDHQFIHVDIEKAKLTPFGGTIAHGFLTLSLLPIMSAKAHLPHLDGIKMGVNYGSDKLRFLSPVRAGKNVRAHFKMLSIEEKRPGQWQQMNEVTVEIEGEDKPALICEWISQFFV